MSEVSRFRGFLLPPFYRLKPEKPKVRPVWGSRAREPSKTRAVRLTRWPAPSVVTTGGPPFTRDTHQPHPGYSAAGTPGHRFARALPLAHLGTAKLNPSGLFPQDRLTTTARSPPAAHLTTGGPRP